VAAQLLLISSVLVVDDVSTRLLHMPGGHMFHLFKTPESGLSRSQDNIRSIQMSLV